MKRRSKILYLDCETTGTNPVENDIWQLGYIIEIDGEAVFEQKMEIRPYNMDNLNEEALKKGNTSREYLEKIDYTISDATRDLKSVWARYVGKYDREDKFTPCGYNILSFDRNFLYEMFRKSGDKYGLGSWCFWPAIDVVSELAKYMLKTGLRLPNYQLGTVCKKFGISLDAHDALSDIQATRTLYLALKDIK